MWCYQRYFIYTGKPKFDGTVPTSLKITEGKNIKLTVNASGNPMPSITWSIGGLSGPGSKGTLVNDNTATYNYNLVIPGVDRSYCGHDLILKATGFKNVDQKNVKLFMSCKYLLLFHFILIHISDLKIY